MLSFEIDCYTTLLKVFLFQNSSMDHTKVRGLSTPQSHRTQDLTVPLCYPSCNTDTLTIQDVPFLKGEN